MLSDMPRLQKISVLAWRVLLVFEWSKEIIWKAADAFGKEGEEKNRLEEDINGSTSPRK